MGGLGLAEHLLEIAEQMSREPGGQRAPWPGKAVGLHGGV